jgi:hypothetical protein
MHFSSNDKISKNQTARGHPTLNAHVPQEKAHTRQMKNKIYRHHKSCFSYEEMGYASGWRLVSRNSEIVELGCSNPFNLNLLDLRFWSPEIPNLMLAISGSKRRHLADRRLAPEKWARIHFIPNLKVGVFVILCAPDVIKPS